MDTRTGEIMSEDEASKRLKNDPFLRQFLNR